MRSGGGGETAPPLAGGAGYLSQALTFPGFALTHCSAAFSGFSFLPEMRLATKFWSADVHFANYTRVLWLAQEPTEELLVQAERAAELMGLRLEVIEVGTHGLERQLEQLIGSAER